MERFSVSNLGPIKRADIKFGDFTLLVGPQASGKSILLQVLKLVEDRHHVRYVLEQNNYTWDKSGDNSQFYDLFFGEGMAAVIKDAHISFNNKSYSFKTLAPKQGATENSKKEKLFYVPAQRVVTMSQGWPRNFGSFDVGDPFVLKQFSESIRVLMGKESVKKRNEQKVFPMTNRIKEPLRKLLDDSIFHGAKIERDDTTSKQRFLLKVGSSSLPFMTWSAGQKEFMPLLLSLYYLMPAAKVSTRDDVKYVIIEEPEMGLHPKAIQALLVTFLELIDRGYKLIVSTHSPVLLEMLWAIKYIKDFGGSKKDLSKLFSIKGSSSLENVFDNVVKEKSFAAYYFEPTENGTTVKDISSLDAGSDDLAIANWGGLTDFSSKASDIVADLVAQKL